MSVLMWRYEVVFCKYLCHFLSLKRSANLLLRFAQRELIHLLRNGGGERL